MRVLYVFISLLLLSQVACKKQSVDGPSENDGIAPAPITVEKTVSLSGAVEIDFTPPSEVDLLAVHASYTGRDGKVRESKVSRFNTSIKVVGFGDTSLYKVKLFAEDKSGNLSAPTEISVKPGVPAITIVRKGLSVIPDFGGLNIKFDNTDGDNLAIVTLANDSLGAFVPINTYYTNLKSGNFSIHGLASVNTKFGIYVRDRWGNISDTLSKDILPLFETQLDRTKMKGVVLKTDAPLGYGGNIAALFDGDVTNNNGYYHTGDAAKMPQWFTFDMGVDAKLSRLVYFMRQGFYYTLHNPRNVEIWGSNNPASDGSFTNWILLATHEQIKPSGLPAGELSQADVDAATAGETINFPLDAPKVRYIRFKTTRNWSDGTYVNFNEIQLFGDPN